MLVESLSMPMRVIKKLSSLKNGMLSKFECLIPYPSIKFTQEKLQQLLSL
jgi:hypothetical protein